MTDTAQPVASEDRVIALRDLRPHPRNYQNHPEDQREHIRRSLLDFGQYKNVVAARDFTLLAGHGVIEGMTDLGWTHADVKVLDLDPDSPLALRLVAGDNEISNLADVDDRALTDLLREISGDPLAGLLGSGFDELQLSALVMTTRPADELARLSASGEWVGMPGFEAAPKNPQVNVQFETEEDRAAFLKLIGVTTTMSRNSVISTWWPERGGVDDLSSVRFQ